MIDLYTGVPSSCHYNLVVRVQVALERFAWHDILSYVTIPSLNIHHCLCSYSRGYHLRSLTDREVPVTSVFYHENLRVRDFRDMGNRDKRSNANSSGNRLG